MAPAAPSAPVLPSLKGLVLDGNFGIGDELFASLLAHAPQLSSLNMVLAGKQAETPMRCHLPLAFFRYMQLGSLVAQWSEAVCAHAKTCLYGP